MLRVLMVLSWACAVLLGIATQLTTDAAVGLLAVAAVIVFAVAGFVWASRTGRHIGFGRIKSIRAALPPGAWPSIRAQLAARQPLDERRHEVVLELAYQQRALLGGQLVFAAAYIPFFLDLIRREGVVFQILFLSICAALVPAAALACRRGNQQVARLLATTPG